MARFETYRLHIARRDAFLIIPTYDMLIFAVLFVLAIHFRKQPELHRRLLDAAFARFSPALFTTGLVYPCLDGVILLGVLRDLLVNRRVHRVYLAAVPILLVTQVFVVHTWQTGSQWWLRIAHSLIG